LFIIGKLSTIFKQDIARCTRQADSPPLLPEPSLSVHIILTGSSAIAEGPRDMLVSRNLATMKHPIRKTTAIDK